ncbi:MAG TPA: glutamine synthetase family protein [Chloroflexota bacterium]|nr:glutamine synthetase family protein [Chloroflexota bacterium]
MNQRATDASHILKEIDEGRCQYVDLQFTDVAGAVKSVVLPARQLGETLAYGHWFDGSSLEGTARTMETDLLLRPDLRTWGILPWTGPDGASTARLLCDVRTPDGEPYPADPRGVLQRVHEEAVELGFSYHVASEVEFYLFYPPQLTPSRAVRSAAAPHAVHAPAFRPHGFVPRSLGGASPATQGAPAGGSPARAEQPSHVTSRPADQGGYFDLAPDPDGRIRDEVTQALQALGVPVAASHHEIGPGQHEIDIPLLPAVAAADAIVTCKFAVRAVARRRGLVATFMPKPRPDAAGSGLHLHQSLQTSGVRDALGDPADEHGLSATGRAFIAGQLAHARAMCGVLAPTVNSYKRLGRGFDAPSYLVWGHTNPLAVIRVPQTLHRRRAALARQGTETAEPLEPLQPELRCADPSCNPYLALASALAASLDGIRANLALPAPVEPSGATGMTLDETQVELLPSSLGEALGELEWDPVVRQALGAPVFERLLLAKEREWQEYRRQVSPWELARYFESA